MKQDLDLTRKLLLQVWNTEFDEDITANPWKFFDPNGEALDRINYHVKLTRDTGYYYPEAIKLEAANEAGQAHAKFRTDALTAKGQEFASFIENDKKWEELKAELAKRGALSALDIGFEIVKGLAKGAAVVVGGGMA